VEIFYKDWVNGAMPNSVYFAERAAHYYSLGQIATNSRHAESLFGLANLFLRLSEDLKVRESMPDLER
jgi:hypothetical protein